MVVKGYKVIALLPNENAPLMRACAALGVHGMVEGESTEVLLFNVGVVEKGQRTYPRSVLSDSLAFYYANLPELPRSSMLVLNALLQQPKANNADIATAVSLSTGRVSNIISTLRKKFTISNRRALADAAKRRGYFAGLYLVFPRGLTVHPDNIKIVDGKTKYRIAL